MPINDETELNILNAESDLIQNEILKLNDQIIALENKRAKLVKNYVAVQDKISEQLIVTEESRRKNRTALEQLGDAEITDGGDLTTIEVFDDPR